MQSLECGWGVGGGECDIFTSAEIYLARTDEVTTIWNCAGATTVPPDDASTNGLPAADAGTAERIPADDGPASADAGLRHSANAAGLQRSAAYADAAGIRRSADPGDLRRSAHAAGIRRSAHATGIRRSANSGPAGLRSAAYAWATPDDDGTAAILRRHDAPRPCWHDAASDRDATAQQRPIGRQLFCLSYGGDAYMFNQLINTSCIWLPPDISPTTHTKKWNDLQHIRTSETNSQPHNLQAVHCAD